MKPTQIVPVSNPSGAITVDTPSAVIIPKEQGRQGPRGYSAYQIAVQEGFVGTEAEWVLSLAGDEGPAGPQGETGPPGADGAQGDTGPQGSQGSQGSQGLQGAQGDTGPQGLQGETGPPGADGADGSDATATTNASDLTSGTLDIARLPAHKSNHATGGSDLLLPSDIGAVPEARTFAGLSLGADRSVPDVRAALGGFRPVHSVPAGIDRAYYSAQNAVTAAAVVTTAGYVNRRMWMPVWLPAGTMTSIHVYATADGTATWRLGLYGHASGDETMPGNLIADRGTVDMAAGPGILSIASSIVIPTAGWHWTCIQVDAYTSNPTVVTISADSGLSAPPFDGWPVQHSSYARSYTGLYDGLGTPGALAASAPTDITANPVSGLDYVSTIPKVWVKR